MRRGCSSESQVRLESEAKATAADPAALWSLEPTMSSSGHSGLQRNATMACISHPLFKKRAVELGLHSVFPSLLSIFENSP